MRKGRPNTPIAEERRRPNVAVVAVACATLVAAVLRLAGLGHSPPGLVQDEAINAWNAWCLLKTGRDMVGTPWPIFYTHSMGGSPTTLLPYLMIPFQWVMGLSVASTRMASIVSGIVAVPLISYAGTRLFGRPAGVLAAAMLAVNPWHVSGTRWAIDGSIVPFLVVAPLAAMLWARLPIAEGDDPPIPGRSALAGIVSGIACFGYWAVRLYFPCFLALAVALNWGRWRAAIRSRTGLMAVAAFSLGFALTFGPLVYEHLTDPGINARGLQTRLWEPGTPFPEIALRMLGRYVTHFGPAFLFVSADLDPGNSPADSGAFELALLPLMVAGAVALIRGARRSASARLLLAMVIAYPTGDMLARYPGVHAFRSSPGVISLVLLAAFGAMASWRWSRGRRLLRSWAPAAAAAITVAALVQDARSLTTYFRDYPKRPDIYALFHTDFMQACAWVRPRFSQADAVFWTAGRVNMPFAMTLVGLGYDPKQWREDPKDVRLGPGNWDYYVRYGKNYFLYRDWVRPYADAMEQGDHRVRALFVVRPHELGLENPVHVIRAPWG